jgi:concentrative nucleoside transporter, CNT family
MHWVPGSLGQILGFFFAPVAWLIGVPWHDCGAIGNLLGTRMALNEVIAYIGLGAQKPRSRRAPSSSPPSPCAASPTSAPSACRSAASARWSPSAATTLARLGVRAMLAGTMANLISASIAGMFLG